MLVSFRMGSSIQSFPAELVELTLIFAAASGNPDAISALAQTCHAFRVLVYQSADQHLWREIFLTTFDDPRVIRNSSCTAPIVGAEASASSSRKADEEFQNSFDWGAEYRLRIWTARFISSRVELEAHTKDDGNSTSSAFSVEDTSRNIRALEALITTMQTALPCPPTIVFSFLSNKSATTTPLTPGNLGLIDAQELLLQPSYPIFPPIPPGQSSKHPQRKNATSNDGSGWSDSLNVAWFDKVLSCGLPKTLSRRLAGTRWPLGNIPYWRENDDDAKELQALGRIVCYIGFVPVPRKLAGSSSSNEARQSTASAAATLSPLVQEGNDGDMTPGVENGEDQSNQDPLNMMNEFASNILSASSTPSTHDMSVAAQHRRARRLGRMRVYNMRYLSRARHWGPYLPAEGVPMSPKRRAANEVEDELLEPILALFASARRTDVDNNEDEDGDHEDTGIEIEIENEDGEEENGGGVSSGQYHLHIVAGDNDHEGSHDSDSEEDITVDRGEEPAAEEPKSLSPPTSAQLRPDWAYLAAVRVVVEANLRDALKRDELAGLVNLEGLRQGSAPREPSDWAVRTLDKNYFAEDAGKGKGKAKVEVPIAGSYKGADQNNHRHGEVEADDEVEGWDWAGVTGVWR